MRFTVTVTVSRIKVLAHKRRANVVAVREFTLSPEDVQSARNWDRRLTREAVRQWLVLRIGDFAKVDDFCADLADGDNDVIIPWANEQSELTFELCMGARAAYA